MGLGAVGTSGCGSSVNSEVTPDGYDVVDPSEGTLPEGDGEVAPPAAVAEDCSTVGDEDGDGLADCLDADCSADPACALPPPAIAEGDCTDGLDGDSDGHIDCADSDCTGDPACMLGPPPIAEDCASPADEDGDGQGQCSDADCVGDPACSGGGGGPWEIDPGILEAVAVEKFPWPGPGPGPGCLSCPEAVTIPEELVLPGF